MNASQRKQVERMLKQRVEKARLRLIGDTINRAVDITTIPTDLAKAIEARDNAEAAHETAQRTYESAGAKVRKVGESHGLEWTTFWGTQYGTNRKGAYWVTKDTATVVRAENGSQTRAGKFNIDLFYQTLARQDAGTDLAGKDEALVNLAEVEFPQALYLADDEEATEMFDKLVKRISEVI